MDVEESKEGFDYSTEDYIEHEIDYEWHKIAEKPWQNAHIFRAKSQRHGESLEEQVMMNLHRFTHLENSVLYHSHQISIWKLDEFDCVKIKE